MNSWRIIDVDSWRIIDVGINMGMKDLIKQR
jgi:hypothetical protein